MYREGIIDLGWGHPDPDLLPVRGLRRAAARVLDRYGADALNYGRAAGPGPLISWLCQRLAETDEKAPTPDSVVVTAGNSHGLDLATTVLTRPGDAVLVEAPTYPFALHILRDHAVQLVPVPTDDDGLDVEALTRTLANLRLRKTRPRLLYTIPTFHNPMGVSLSAERRRRLVEMASAEQLLIVEDDVYRELSYDGPAPASLWSIAPAGVVVRLGSFAKSLAPGLRCGFITADPSTAQQLQDSGVLDSGGGISHFTGLVVAEFAASGDFASNVERLKTAYQQRRNALLAALSEQLEGRASWRRPAGGYFVWLRLPAERDANALLKSAEAEGTSYMPGGRFYLGPNDGGRFIRLAFSHYPATTLVEGARRLGAAFRQ